MKANKTVKGKKGGAAAGVAAVYGEVRGKLEGQLEKIGRLMDEAVEARDVGAVKAVATAQKEVLNCYNEASRLEKVAGVEEGRFVPVEVMDVYQERVFPAIVSAQDALLTNMLAGLPEPMRAAAQAAWVQAYPLYSDAVARAGDELDMLMAEVREQAAGERQANNKRKKVLGKVGK